MVLEQEKITVRKHLFVYYVHFSKTPKLLWIWENYFKRLKH